MGKRLRVRARGSRIRRMVRATYLIVKEAAIVMRVINAIKEKAIAKSGLTTVAAVLPRSPRASEISLETSPFFIILAISFEMPVVKNLANESH